MDHYRTLQVARHAEQEVIEKAYRALSLKYHPDVVDARRRSSATERMQRINRAYAVLGDPVARAAYDCTLGPDGALYVTNNGIFGHLGDGRRVELAPP